MFEASRDWFICLRKHRSTVGEAASANVEVATSYLEDLATIIDEGHHIKQ
jgi:hypothetical protein